jgi:DNA invertase Pin-like site-specific DNA recombinase
LLGYARISTRDQDLDAQFAELKAAGCAKVYSEKASGARNDRAELAKLMKRLQPADVLLVTRLDPLARSTRDLLNVLDTVKQAGAGFRSLKDTWADTTTPHGQLMLTILGGLAEFERSLIVARTGEGRERAKTRGVRFGRPTALTPFQRAEALRRHDAGDAVIEIARSFNVDSRATARTAPSRNGHRPRRDNRARPCSASTRHIGSARSEALSAPAGRDWRRDRCGSARVQLSTGCGTCPSGGWAVGFSGAASWVRSEILLL